PNRLSDQQRRLASAAHADRRLLCRRFSRSSKPEFDQHVHGLQIRFAAYSQGKGKYHQHGQPGWFNGAAICDNLRDDERSDHSIHKGTCDRRSGARSARQFRFARQYLHAALAGGDRRFAGSGKNQGRRRRGAALWPNGNGRRNGKALPVHRRRSDVHDRRRSYYFWRGGTWLRTQKPHLKMKIVTFQTNGSAENSRYRVGVLDSDGQILDIAG